MTATNTTLIQADGGPELWEALDCGLLVIDPRDGVVLAHNRQASALLGMFRPDLARLGLGTGLEQALARAAAGQAVAQTWPLEAGPGPDGLRVHLAPGRWRGRAAVVACLRPADGGQRLARRSAQLESVLGKRVQELDCLYNLISIMESAELSLDEVLQAAAEQLPRGFQHAEAACARLSLDGQAWASPGFALSPWRLAVPLMVGGQERGGLEVVYRAPRPPADEGPFLIEERVLLEVVAGRLARLIERRQAQQELRRQRDFARELLEGTQALVLFLDEDGRVLHYNRALAGLTGAPLEGARLADFCANFLPADQADRQRPFFIANGDGSQGVLRTLPIRCAQGGWRQVEWSVQPLRGAWAGMQGWLCTGQDLTARLTAEGERDRLADVVAQAEDGVAISDPQGSLTYANRAWLDLHGVRAAQALGAPAPFLAEAVADPGAHRQFWASLGLRRSWRGRRVITGPDGGQREVQTQVTALRDQAGGLSGYVARERDVTQDEKMRGYLRQAHKMEALGRLAGGVAHDFNNILAAVSGYCELAQMSLAAPERLGRYLEQALVACQRAKELVRQILTFSRQTEQARRPVDVNEIVVEALKLLRATLPSTIRINHHLPENPALTLADPTQLHQIMMNLGTNAGQAMGAEGGKLEVDLSLAELDPAEAAAHPDLQPGPYLRLSVSDTGHDMSAQVAERVFEPFFTTKPSGEGTGLGLAVVHGIVKACQGSIRVYSEPGRGTSFHIMLPRLTEGQAGVALDDQHAPGGSGHVLVVDDEPTLVDVLKRLLIDLGYRVSPFNDSVLALKAFQERPQDYDLVLADLTMPGLTGLDLTWAVRRLRAELPVVLCTGFSDALTQERAQAAGVSEVLLKPVLRRELALALRRALDASNETTV
ncbi:MAG: PAS domain-containing protein [Pseudomonadota bacterium]